ncbi:MAG: adenosylmethionine decarboxylase [Bacillota bacterium]
MDATSRHVLAEFYGCPHHLLNDVKVIEKKLTEAALAAGAEIREVAFHKFAPQGVSGVVIISESHLSIHTWPELGYAAVDVFTCGTTVNPWDACKFLEQSLEAERVIGMEVSRGSDTPLKAEIKEF